MRIAYTGPVSLGIIKSYLRLDSAIPESRLKYAHGARLVVGLLKRGHSVCVITPCELVKSVKTVEAGNCCICLIPQRRSRYQLLTFHHKEVQLMVGCLKMYKPDVVFSQWLYMYSRAALLSGFPTLVVGRDSPWRVARLMSSFRMWHRAIYSKIFVAPLLKNLTTISPHMISDLVKWWGRSESILVIPNALPDGLVTSENKCINEKARTIVCVSEWNELKNVKTLLMAFVSLRDLHPDWRLVLYGNSMLPDAACGLWMKNRGYSLDRIELRGYGQQEDIRKFLFQESDVFCSPSLEESFGQVFLEAMAQGVPCVGGERSGAVPWVLGCERSGGVEKLEVDELQGGIVCDVSRPEKLAECIERVMEDVELRRQLSEGGLRRVRDMFDIKKSVQMYETELKRIAVNH